MSKTSVDIKRRKIEHINIVLEGKAESPVNPFDKYSLDYNALPNIDLKKIETSITFFGKNLSFPFLISSMTGGAAKAEKININLANAAEEMKVGLGLGSMRVIITNPESAKSFQVRKYCKSIPLFANLGLVQLNYGFGLEEINKVIDIVQADGIFLHLNHLQEAIQEHGDPDYSNLLNKLESIIKKIQVPVLIKEVGHGIDYKTAKDLYEIGVKWIDVAGVGGTSWAKVEGLRNNDVLGDTFAYSGIPTDMSIKCCSKIKGLNLIAGGGIRSGVDIAKALCLGAKMTTAAKPLLAPALESENSVIKVLQQYKKELEIAMYCIGIKKVNQFDQDKISIK